MKVQGVIFFRGKYKIVYFSNEKNKRTQGRYVDEHYHALPGGRAGCKEEIQGGNIPMNFKTGISEPP